MATKDSKTNTQEEVKGAAAAAATEEKKTPLTLEEKVQKLEEKCNMLESMMFMTGRIDPATAFMMSRATASNKGGSPADPLMFMMMSSSAAKREQQPNSSESYKVLTEALKEKFGEIDGRLDNLEKKENKEKISFIKKETKPASSNEDFAKDLLAAIMNS